MELDTYYQYCYVCVNDVQQQNLTIPVCSYATRSKEGKRCDRCEQKAQNGKPNIQCQPAGKKQLRGYKKPTHQRNSGRPTHQHNPGMPTHQYHPGMPTPQHNPSMYNFGSGMTAPSGFFYPAPQGMYLPPMQHLTINAGSAPSSNDWSKSESKHRHDKKSNSKSKHSKKHRRRRDSSSESSASSSSSPQSESGSESDSESRPKSKSKSEQIKHLQRRARRDQERIAVLRETITRATHQVAASDKQNSKKRKRDDDISKEPATKKSKGAKGDYDYGEILRGRPKKRGKCHTCGEEGHFKANCPKKKNRNNQ